MTPPASVKEPLLMSSCAAAAKGWPLSVVFTSPSKKLTIDQTSLTLSASRIPRKRANQNWPPFSFFSFDFVDPIVFSNGTIEIAYPGAPDQLKGSTITLSRRKMGSGLTRLM
jgi:hypothetical protein